MNTIKIQKIKNGFLLDCAGSLIAFHTLEDVFTHLLQHYEGLAYTFKGDLYGKVIIERGKNGKIVEDVGHNILK